MERELVLLLLTLATLLGLIAVGLVVIVVAAMIQEAIHSAIDDYRAGIAAKKAALATAKADAQFWAEIRAQLTEQEISDAVNLPAGKYLMSHPRKISG